MLDEDLLVGPGRQARDTLRPLAYSTLADLVHHVKDRIDLDQVSRVIQVRERVGYHELSDCKSVSCALQEDPNAIHQLVSISPMNNSSGACIRCSFVYQQQETALA